MKITDIKRRPKILPDGRFLEVYEITFTSDKGLVSTVDVPVGEFTPEVARARAKELAEMLDATLD